MSKGKRRRSWAAQAERKRNPEDFYGALAAMTKRKTKGKQDRAGREFGNE